MLYQILREIVKHIMSLQWLVAAILDVSISEVHGPIGFLRDRDSTKHSLDAFVK